MGVGLVIATACILTVNAEAIVVHALLLGLS